MLQYKLANIILSDSERFACAPGLLCRSNKAIRPLETEDDVWILPACYSYDFATYFNAFSSAKWLKYTTVREVHLSIEVKGGSGFIMLTRADSLNWQADTIPSSKIDFPASDEWHTIDIPLPLNPHDVIEGFVIEAQSDIQIRNGFYYTNIPEAEFRTIELAVCTTTFKKEQFILRNVSTIRNQIACSNDPIADHFQMYVVDNGRTLSLDDVESDRIHLIPNPNVGGSGGFARGMIAALEQTPKATHVLLMDDDVAVMPESIIRTFNLLSLTKDEYAEAFLSGAMLSLDDPCLQWEDRGFVNREGFFLPLKREATSSVVPETFRMDTLHSIVANESFENPCNELGFEDREEEYAAWWYCCIPMSMIEKHGLPLPLFVRGDDVEFSRRCKPRFMSMNGIAVWHAPFNMRYSAAQERYQMTRNCYIAQFVGSIGPEVDLSISLEHYVKSDLKKFNYTDAELALDGFEDFLRGPEWIMKPVAGDAFMQANSRAEKMQPFSQIADQARALGVDLESLTINDILRERARSTIESLQDHLTDNGQKLLPQPSLHKKIAVIDGSGFAYPASKIRGAKYIIALDLPSKKGTIRHIDRKRYDTIMKRLKEDRRFYQEHKDELRAAYAQALPEMTTVDFWKNYLSCASTSRK